MNKNIELKPCPNCDGEILLYSNGPKRGVYAKCKACGSEYPIPVKIKTWKSNPIRISDITIRKAKEQWNRMYVWNYGENGSQYYYDVKLGNDYLCVFANKEYPDVWMGFYTKNGRDITIKDRTYSNYIRKKDEKNKYPHPYPSAFRFLSNKDPEIMKRKLIYAYEHDLDEVSR